MIPAVGAYGAREAVRWAEQAAGAGAPAVMALPPNSYRCDERGVLEHYRALAAVGLPVVAYNNPIDTKVDLVPELLARLHAEGLIVAVKEFAGDPRRAYVVRELAPELDVLIGSDDTVLRDGAGRREGLDLRLHERISRACVELYRASVAGDLATALPLYRALHRCFAGTLGPSSSRRSSSRWRSSDVPEGRVARRASSCPREHEDEIRRLTENALAGGLS